MKKLLLSILAGALFASFASAGPEGVSPNNLDKQGGHDIILNGPTTCPELNTIFGQDPIPPAGSWMLYTSDASPNILCFDNFWDLYDPIGDLHWWGSMLNFYQGWEPCDEIPATFLIHFYADAGGMPGTVVCTYVETVFPVYVGMWGSFPVYYFSVDPLIPWCYLTNGWVSIQGVGGDEDCWFMWLTSAMGDLFAYQQWADGSMNILDEDFAFCLTWDISEVDIPQSIQLNQNYPNPFNPTTTIDYSLTQVEQVNLSVYSLAGELVVTLVSGEVPVGDHSVTFDATDMPSGVYFYTLTAGSFVKTKKMVLVK